MQSIFIRDPMQLSICNYCVFYTFYFCYVLYKNCITDVFVYSMPDDWDGQNKYYFSHILQSFTYLEYFRALFSTIKVVYFNCQLQCRINLLFYLLWISHVCVHFRVSMSKERDTQHRPEAFAGLYIIELIKYTLSTLWYWLKCFDSLLSLHMLCNWEIDGNKIRQRKVNRAILHVSFI